MTDDKPFEQLVHRMNPQNKLVRAWELKGGVSAQVTALEIQHPDGRTQKVVVRQHGQADLGHNPHIAADEFRLLQFLQTAQIPVPEPYFVDASGEIFETPCIVMEFIEAQSAFALDTQEGMVRQLAAQLAQIHTIQGTTQALSFLPRQHTICETKLRERPVRLDDRLAEGRIRAALARAWPWPQHNADVLLHGDFWSGNVLWRENRIVAVIDWEDAATGDPLADLANSRLEILWAFGAEAMQQFTQHYQSLVSLDFTTLAYWDLYAALKPAGKLWTWGLGAETEQAMRVAHQQFVNDALEKL